MGLADTLHCFGFYGFGSGWSMAKQAAAGKPLRRIKDDYCGDACPLRVGCWATHRVRVADVDPDFEAEERRLAADGVAGSRIVRHFVETHERQPPTLALVIANIEAGQARREGREPPDRGAYTLTDWPLGGS